MRPRLSGRGKADKAVSVPTTRSGFNEAAAVKPRKAPTSGYVAIYAIWLQ